MDGQQCLLFLRFYSDKSHRRSRDGLANRLCINSIGLAAFDIRLDVGCRHEPHIMTNCVQLTRPVMSRSACFDPDKATWQLLEELEQLSAPNCSIEDDRTVRSDTVSLENVLTKIQSYCCNFHGGVPFVTEDDFYSMPQSATVGCRRHPPHPHFTSWCVMQRTTASSETAAHDQRS